MAPVVATIETEYEDIAFNLIDVEKDSRGSKLMRQLGQSYVPAFYIVDADGEIVEQWTGARDGDEIRAILDTLVK